MQQTILSLTAHSALLLHAVLSACAVWTRWLVHIPISLQKVFRVPSSATLVHGPETANVFLVNGKVTSIHDIVRHSVPTLFTRYEPAWWLPFGDLQTIWNSAVYPRYAPHVHYERKYIIVPDGGCISLDVTPRVSTQFPMETPVVLVLHGLLGGSQTAYVRSAVSRITRPVEHGGLGFRAIVFNLRGCSGTPVTSPLLYHPGMTDDVRSVVLYISSQYPQAKLFALGFSLGAGYLTNYLAEEGEASPLTAGFVISNVWDYAGCSLELAHGRLISQVFYNPVLGLGHKQVITQNRAVFTSSHPGLDALLDRPLVTMSWFTAQFMAGTAGVDPVQFLHDTSCGKSVAGVRIPLVCLNARDDPLLPERYLPVGQVRTSKHVLMVVTDRGGHLGWFTAAKDRRAVGELDVWYIPAIIEYFQAMLQIRERARPSPRATPPDTTGMVHQVGRPNVGYKEVSSDCIHDLVTQSKGLGKGNIKLIEARRTSSRTYLERRNLLPIFLYCVTFFQGLAASLSFLSSSIPV